MTLTRKITGSIEISPVALYIALYRCLDNILTFDYYLYELFTLRIDFVNTQCFINGTLLSLLYIDSRSSEWTLCKTGCPNSHRSVNEYCVQSLVCSMRKTSKVLSTSPPKIKKKEETHCYFTLVFRLVVFFQLGNQCPRFVLYICNL